MATGDLVAGAVSRLKREDCTRTKHTREFSKWKMQSKSDAIKTETQLLNTFDYAWNTSINGTRRPDDILIKLKEVSSSNIHFSDIARKLVPYSQTRVGIRIKAGKYPFAEEKIDRFADEESQSYFSRVFKFGRSQPRLVQDRNVVLPEDTTICGVVLGHDSVCRRPPVEGRKRCAEHKGMRIKGSVAVRIFNRNVDSQPTLAVPSSSHDSEKLQPDTVNYNSSECFTSICGFILSDGSPCTTQPHKGNKRCLDHKGMRIHKPNSVSVTKEKLYHLPDHLVSKTESSKICFSRERQAQAFPKRSNTNYDTICGVVLGDGLLCTREPVAGRVRCEEHKGMRIHKPNSVSVTKEKLYHLPDHLVSKTKSSEICFSRERQAQAFPKRSNTNYDTICGVVLGDGLLCTREPVAGRVRCEKHKGMRVNRLTAKSAAA